MLLVAAFAADNCLAVTPRTLKMLAKCLFLNLSNILSLLESWSLVLPFLDLVT